MHNKLTTWIVYIWPWDLSISSRGEGPFIFLLLHHKDVLTSKFVSINYHYPKAISSFNHINYHVCLVLNKIWAWDTYIHTYFIGSSPRGFSESILHYKIVNQVLHYQVLRYLCICRVFPGELSSKQQQWLWSIVHSYIRWTLQFSLTLQKYLSQWLCMFPIKEIIPSF